MENLMENSNVKQAVPFFMIANTDSSFNFYVLGLDFELKNKWEQSGKIEWCWHQLDNASIMLQDYRHNPLEKLGGA